MSLVGRKGAGDLGGLLTFCAAGFAHANLLRVLIQNSWVNAKWILKCLWLWFGSAVHVLACAAVWYADVQTQRGEVLGIDRFCMEPAGTFIHVYFCTASCS